MLMSKKSELEAISEEIVNQQTSLTNLTSLSFGIGKLLKISLFWKRQIRFCFICMFCPYVCYVPSGNMCTWCPHKQKRALEQELRMVGSHHVGAGPELWTSGKAASALNIQAISPAPQSLLVTGVSISSLGSMSLYRSLILDVLYNLQLYFQYILISIEHPINKLSALVAVWLPALVPAVAKTLVEILPPWFSPRPWCCW